MKRVFDQNDIEEPTRHAPCDLELNLKNRRKLDQCLGLSRLLKFFLRLWLKPGRTYRILELAAGTGDGVRAIAEWSRKQHVTVQIDALDFHPPLLDIARRQSAGFPEIAFIHADPRSFCGGETYDVVCCLNALRSLSEEDAARVILRATEASHDKILVAGLERNFASLPGVYFMTATLFGLPLMQSETRLSIRRSFSFGELDELAQRAGWRIYGHRRFLPASQAIWMCKREEQGVADCQLPEPDFAG